jgi:hypothetical protein
MVEYDGDQPIKQGFFRHFLTWLSSYINTILDSGTVMVLDAVRYITPVDYDPAPSCGKIIAPFAHLIIEGAGVKPTVPNPASTTPDEIGFDQSSDIMPGGFAYNLTDNLWYYRGGDTIYELKDALSIGIADISGLLEDIGSLQPKETGKGLSTNDLTNDMVAAIAAATAHINIENIHLPPDGVSIDQSSDDALEVIPSWIRGLFSADLPLAIDSDGKITIAIDDTTLAIVDGKLTVIGGGGGDSKLKFDTGTNVLSVDPTGASSVDLSSLVSGGADLSNFVKKTGESSQTIEGDLLVTGEIGGYE